MLKHIMLDLETFGTKPYSAIIAIGAVHFDPTKQGDDAIIDKFCATIDPVFLQRHAFRFDMDTVMWWMDPAQREALDQWQEAVHYAPEIAFDGFRDWLAHQFGDARPDDWEKQVAIWGNGATFDNTLLRQGYEVLGRDAPWKHYNDKCFRTLKNLAGAKEVIPPFGGVKHNALNDAEHQALWLCNINRHLELGIE